MANGLQIAASGLIAQERHLDAVANDIANVNTVGYQQSRTAFSEVLGSSGGVRVSDAGTSSAAGRARRERQPALGRDRRPRLHPGSHRRRRVALTRDGDLQGRRRRASSPSRAAPSSTRRSPSRPTSSRATISIAPDGTVTAAGRKLGQLTLVDVPAPDALAAVGDGLLAHDRRQRRREARRTGASLQQGVLEQSNVDLATALTDMMDAQRAFQLASRALHTQDQLLEIANGIRR